MLQSLSLKLVTSKEDDDLLIGTMTEYNKACNWVADKIFGLNVSKFQLQKMLYYDVKSLFNLPSQSVIRLIAKVVEAYKRDIKIKPVFRELGAIQYDDSSIGLDKISLTTFRGKKRLALKTGDLRFEDVQEEYSLDGHTHEYRIEIDAILAEGLWKYIMHKVNEL